MGAMCRGELLEEAQRTAFVLTPDREAALRDCLSLLRQLQNSLPRTSHGGSLYRLGTTEQTLNLFFTGDRKYIPLYSIRQGRKPQPLRRQPGNAGTAAPGTVVEGNTSHSDLRHPLWPGAALTEPANSWGCPQTNGWMILLRFLLLITRKLPSLHSR